MGRSPTKRVSSKKVTTESHDEQEDTGEASTEISELFGSSARSRNLNHDTMDMKSTAGKSSVGHHILSGASTNTNAISTATTRRRAALSKYNLEEHSSSSTAVNSTDEIHNSPSLRRKATKFDTLKLEDQDNAQLKSTRSKSTSPRKSTRKTTLTSSTDEGSLLSSSTSLSSENKALLNIVNTNKSDLNNKPKKSFHEEATYLSSNSNLSTLAIIVLILLGCIVALTFSNTISTEALLSKFGGQYRRKNLPQAMELSIHDQLEKLQAKLKKVSSENEQLRFILYEIQKKAGRNQSEEWETVRSSRNSTTIPEAFLPAKKNVEPTHESEYPKTLKKDHAETSTVTDWKPVKENPTHPKTFSVLPSSSVWCKGNNRSSRICQFRNLCFHPGYQKWFIAKTKKSLLENVPLDRYREGILELSTVEDHNIFYWTFSEVDPFEDEFRNVSVRYEETKTFLFSRLHPNNIMHSLHDDVIGLYHLLKEHVGKGSAKYDFAFSLNHHRLFMLDPYGYSPATRPYQYLTNMELYFSSYLYMDLNTITCFRDAVVGNTKTTTWYQYGFAKPQGPIENKNKNGHLVREVSDWFVRRLKLPLYAEEIYDPNLSVEQYHKIKKVEDWQKNSQWNLIVILSRKTSRLILNEKELSEHLKNQYNLNVVIVSNEVHSFEEQIKYLRRARVVLGMHGSILIMGIFCRKGTVFLEMFPFGIPAENYTPYKTMAELSGMDLIYKVWVNPDETKSVPAPERNHEQEGGTAHLTPEEKEDIRKTKTVPIHICCKNKYWLYRIYQDTIVDIARITELIQEGLEDSAKLSERLGLNLEPLSSSSTNRLEKVGQDVLTTSMKVKTGRPQDQVTEAGHSVSLLAIPIHNLECVQQNPNRPPGTVWLTWKTPWNNQHVRKFVILVRNTQKHYLIENGTSIVIPGFKPGQKVDMFIRIIQGDFVGEYGSMASCVA